jgi:DNA adenine methylase
MVKEYTCEKCGKVFFQKGHFMNHQKRKRPCKPIENKIIKEKVQEKIKELSENGEIEIKNKNLILNNQNSNVYNMNNILKKDIPKPLLKWVGGKGQIIEKLLKKLPKKINNYHEIFVGGGSFLIMVLWAKEKNYITIDGDINVYDLNEALIETYNNIKNNKDKLFESIKQIETEFNSCEIEGDVKRKPINKEDAMTSKESYYYWIRKQYNEEKDKSSIKSSSYFIFLNKTGFRGMYREGPNGFNIPYGNYKNPKIIDKDELDYISELIKNVNFYNSDFSKSFENIQEENNFIYLDPPYAPENDKSFVGYTKDGFDIKQHELLFDLTNKISEKNMIMMSNANVQLLRDSLSDKKYKYEVVSCRRAINSKNPGAKTEEVIITNY